MYEFLYKTFNEPLNTEMNPDYLNKINLFYLKRILHFVQTLIPFCLSACYERFIVIFKCTKATRKKMQFFFNPTSTIEIEMIKFNTNENLKNLPKFNFKALIFSFKISKIKV